jgi:hypothetical protein
MYLYILRRGQKETPWKMENQQLVILNDNAPAHRSVLVKGLLAKNNVTTLEHPPHWPDLAAADFYLFRFWNQHWRDGVFVMVSLRMRRKKLKGCHKTAFTNVSPRLHSLAEVCSCRGGLFWRKYGLKGCNLLHFSAIKLFRYHFEATSDVGAKISKTIWLITALFLVITQRVRRCIADVSGQAVIHIGSHISSRNVGTKLPILST